MVSVVQVASYMHAVISVHRTLNCFMAESSLGGGSSDQLSPIHPSVAKKQKRQCSFNNKWIEEFKGIGKSHKGKHICVSM